MVHLSELIASLPVSWTRTAAVGHAAVAATSLSLGSRGFALLYYVNTFITLLLFFLSNLPSYFNIAVSPGVF